MATTHHTHQERGYAGLFRRLGWSTKKFTNIADAQIERPWVGLAEWLRAAHSLLDEKTAELTRNDERSGQVRAIE